MILPVTHVLSSTTFARVWEYLGFGFFFHSLTTMTFSEKGLVCTWVVLIVVKMVNNLHFKKAAHISICPLLLLKLVLQMCLSK